LADLINKKPSYLPAYRNIGVTFSDLGMHEQAVQYWQRATVYDSTGDYDYNIGINFANRGQVNVAKDWYIKAAKKGKPEAIGILKANGVQY
jgi:tetratricopeptide (TPR) repeat protein